MPVIQDLQDLLGRVPTFDGNRQPTAGLGQRLSGRLATIASYATTESKGP